MSNAPIHQKTLIPVQIYSLLNDNENSNSGKTTAGLIIFHRIHLMKVMVILSKNAIFSQMYNCKQDLKEI